MRQADDVTCIVLVGNSDMSRLFNQISVEKTKA